MSKRSKLALILAMLLSTSAVISACNDGAYSSSSDSSSGDSSTSALTPAEEEDLANETYKARIDKWMKYVEYNKSDDAVKELSTTKFATGEDGKLSVNVFDNIYVKTEIGDMEKTFTVPNPNYTPDEGNADEGNPDAGAGDAGAGGADNAGEGEPAPVEPEFIEELVKTGEYTKTTVYKKETGEKLTEFTQTEYELTEDNKKLLDPDKRKSDEVLYEFASVHASVWEVKKTEYLLKAMVINPDLDTTVEPNPAPETAPAAVEGDENETEVDAYDTLVENYEAVVTYSYYDVTTGECLAENLEEQATRRSGNLLDIGDKTYAMDEDGIVKVFDLGMEYALPMFDKTNQQSWVEQDRDGSYNCHYDEYVYFEQGDYGYYIDEEEVLASQSGDFGRGIFPGVSVNVYKDYNLVAAYETDAFNVWGYTVLPNGNVYFCEIRQLPQDATEYDFGDTINKYDVVHTVLDVTTGTTSQLNLGFVASKIYADSTQEINTTLQKNTLGEENILHSLNIKEGYVLAEIQTFKDGALTGESTFAALNSETMEIVEELPKIVDTQFGYASFVSENEMLFATKAFDDKSVFYTANVKTGDLELFAKEAQGNITPLQKDCFLYGKKVYDYAWNEVKDSNGKDLTGYDEIYVIDDGKLLLHAETHSNTSNYKSMEWSVCFIEGSSSGYQKRLSIVTLFSDSTYSSYDTLKEVDYEGNYFVEENNGKRTVYGWIVDNSSVSKYTLLADSERQETVHEEGDNAGKYVRYSVTTTITNIAPLADGEYLVRVEEAWDEGQAMHYGNDETPSDEVLANSEKTYVTYYIMK